VTRTRSFILIVLAIAAVYLVVQAPTQSADIIRQGISAIGDFLRAIGTFFSSLFSG